jgi:hypothetical protein
MGQKWYSREAEVSVLNSKSLLKIMETPREGTRPAGTCQSIRRHCRPGALTERIFLQAPGRTARSWRWDFSPGFGTVEVFMPHTRMNYNRSKSNDCPVKECRSRARLPQRSGLSRASSSGLSPARQLLICLGWIRLFEVISSGSEGLSTRRPALYDI